MDRHAALLVQRLIATADEYLMALRDNAPQDRLAAAKVAYDASKQPLLRLVTPG